MLTGRHTGFRFKIAVAFCAFAAACFVLLPTAALAFGSGADMADCFYHADMVDQDMSHLHDGAQAHAHASPGSQDRDDRDPTADCCDVTFSSALLADGGDVVNRDTAASLHFPAQEPRHLSRVPELPDRPPIFLLVV